MTRREHVTILVDTLQVLEGASRSADDASLTRLAARANVPFDRFQANVRELQVRGLLTPDRPYRPTEKGAELLRQLDSWRTALRTAGLAILEA